MYFKKHNVYKKMSLKRYLYKYQLNKLLAILYAEKYPSSFNFYTTIIHYENIRNTR